MTDDPNPQPDSQEAMRDLIQHIYPDELNLDGESVFNNLTPTSSFELATQPASMDVVRDMVLNAPISPHGLPVMHVHHNQTPAKQEPQFEETSPADSGYNQPQSNETICISNDDRNCSKLSRPAPVAAMYEIEPQPIIQTQTQISGTPSRTNVLGEYSFNFLFKRTVQATKSINHTHSSSLEKLYVKMGVPCPVQFSYSKNPPSGSHIRAMLVYSNDENAHCPVCRCANHEINDPSSVSAHVLQVVRQRLGSIDNVPTYEKNNGRFSVIMPFLMPSVNDEQIQTVLYTFMCRTSCIGGMNRRSAMAVFTLEDNHGTVIGRACLDVKICSSPGRDCKKEEKKLENHSQQNKRELIPSQQNRRELVPKKRLRLVTDPSSRFCYVKVRQENFRIISKINNALNLALIATDYQRQQCCEENTGALLAELLAKYFEAH